MKKQEIPKREKVYFRKRWVARRFAVFLLGLLAVNHFMQMGFLLLYFGCGQKLCIYAEILHAKPWYQHPVG